MKNENKFGVTKLGGRISNQHFGLLFVLNTSKRMIFPHIQTKIVLKNGGIRKNVLFQPSSTLTWKSREKKFGKEKKRLKRRIQNKETHQKAPPKIMKITAMTYLAAENWSADLTAWLKKMKPWRKNSKLQNRVINVSN